MSNLKEIQKKIEKNSKALDEITQLTLPETHEINDDPKLLIGRKWNSWYPSYFNVLGGGYIFQIKGEIIVIDPGFNFTRILRDFGLNPKYVNSIFLTHLHADHVAGLIEFVTIRFTLSDKTEKDKTLPPLIIYANESNFKFFSHIIKGNTLLNQINPGSIIRIKSQSGNTLTKVKIIRAHHREQGGQDSSIGLIFNITSKSGIKYNIGIMSDTDGSEEYMEDYKNNYNEVDVIIPHLGTAEEGKYPTGEKHLYLSGLDKIINTFGNPRLFLIGEFGLEMGCLPEIVNGVSTHIFSRPRYIFREAIPKMRQTDSLTYGALFIISLKAMIKKGLLVEILIDIGELLNSENKVWIESKTSWTEKKSSIDSNITPPVKLLNVLKFNETISYRRVIDYLKYFETKLKPQIETMENFLMNINKTGLLEQLNEVVNSLKIHNLVKVYYNNKDLILRRLISDKCLEKNLSKEIGEILQKKDYLRGHFIVDQILVASLLFILVTKNYRENQKIISVIKTDYRNEIAKYYDTRFKKDNKRIIAGEYGTSIQFKDEIYIKSLCEGCKKFLKYTRLRNYTKSEYIEEKGAILHLRRKCKYCEAYENFNRYEDEGYGYEYDPHEIDRLQDIEDDIKKGKYAYIYPDGPSMYQNIFIETSNEVYKKLESHLRLIDSVNLEIVYIERMITKSIKCPDCNSFIFEITVSNETVVICANESCPFELKFNRDLINIKEFDDKNLLCGICNHSKFEISIGFEYLNHKFSGKKLLDDEFSKIHICIDCLYCDDISPICCDLAEKDIYSWFVALLYPEGNNENFKQKEIYNLLDGLSIRRLEDLLSKMSSSNDLNENKIASEIRKFSKKRNHNYFN